MVALEATFVLVVVVDAREVKLPSRVPTDKAVKTVAQSMVWSELRSSFSMVGKNEVWSIGPTWLRLMEQVGISKMAWMQSRDSGRLLLLARQKSKWLERTTIPKEG